MSEPDFFEVVKYVKKEPEISEENLQVYFDQGMWPDKPHEHVGFFKTEDAANDCIESLEESRTKEGWIAAKRPRYFR